MMELIRTRSPMSHLLRVQCEVCASGSHFAEPGQPFVHWRYPDGRVIRVEVRLLPDEAGGLTGTVPALPGVVSEGESEEETMENVKAALRATIREYHESGGVIPWVRQTEGAQANEISRWITVDA